MLRRGQNETLGEEKGPEKGDTACLESCSMMLTVPGDLWPMLSLAVCPRGSWNTGYWEQLSAVPSRFRRNEIGLMLLFGQGHQIRGLGPSPELSSVYSMPSP